MVNQTTKVAITFPKRLVQQAAQYSVKEYGIKFPELVRHLLVEFIKEHNKTVILSEESIREVGTAFEDFKRGDYMVVDPRNERALNQALRIE